MLCVSFIIYNSIRSNAMDSEPMSPNKTKQPVRGPQVLPDVSDDGNCSCDH